MRDTSLSSVTCSEEPYLSSLSDLSPARALLLLSIFSCSDTNTNTSMNSENATANITRIIKIHLKLGQVGLTIRTNNFGKVHVLVVGGLLGAAVYSI